MVIVHLQGGHADILCSVRYALHDVSVYSRCWHA